MNNLISSNNMNENNEIQEGTTNIDEIVLPAPATCLETLKPPTSERRDQLNKWLGKTFRVVITDGRVLVGFFNCTDKDANVVLSMCAEYLEEGKDARILGNVMIPGKHIVSIAVDMPSQESTKQEQNSDGITTEVH